VRQKTLLLITLPFVLAAGNSVGLAEPQQAASNAPEKKVVYVPPSRGAPKSRVGGGTRGVDPNAIIVRLLAPEDTGMSSKDQPVLYWFLSQPAETRLEVTLIDDTSVEPLLEINTSAQEVSGIQALRLAEYGIHLKPKVEYEWSVALIVDPEQRSKDVLASGTIMHVVAPDAFKARLVSARPEDLPAVYAAEGYWYDAIESISSLINATPDDRQVREQRAVLLDEVALPEVASYDRE
jgi:hypothetical protein